ncbi:MAG TPA: VIT domain-containing protein [Verrucomicrobiae bacterium]
MKRIFWALLLGLLLGGSLQQVNAAGLIVVEPGKEGIIAPEPMPPIPPRPIPHPHRPPPSMPVMLPLETQQQKVDVTIRDQIARTEVEQVFYNPNGRRIEGTFLFPVPKGAQIDKFTMDINGQPVQAELLKADKAKAIYEEIVRKLKDPALLEYAGRDLYKVRIFPIEPQEKKRVKLIYTQLLKEEQGLVEYALPLNPDAADKKTPLAIKVQIDSRTPLKTIYSPTHSVDVKREGDRKATLGYEANSSGSARQFQFFFARQTDEIGIQLITQRDGDEGHFLLFLSPGQWDDKTKVVPKDVLFVVDTSGSMAGKKMEQARKALQFCVENLNDKDRFDIVRFSTETEPLFNGFREVNRESRQKAQTFVEGLKPIGGTAIHAALQTALKLRPDSVERPYFVIFVTDGMPTVGETREETIVQLVTSDVARKTRVFCFGVGHDVNTHLLDRITEQTRAVSTYVLPEEDLELKLSGFFARIKDPVLASPELKVKGDVTVTQLYPNPLPDLFNGDQLVLSGKFKGHGAVAIELTGQSGKSKKTIVHEVTFPKSSTEHDFIPRLWAMRRVGWLLDEIRLRGENAELRDEVTDLARRYGIVTPYTAYLILEDEKQRGVPATAQTQNNFRLDVAAQDATKDAWRRSKEERSGSFAVSGARMNQALRGQAVVAEALEKNRAEAPMAASPMPAAAPPALGSRVSGVVSAPVAKSIHNPSSSTDYTQQNRYAGGRAFYQNGPVWTDALVQKQSAQARRVQLPFASKEYFDLMQKHPEVKPWLALGNRVQFVLADTVYEVTE